MHVYPGIKAITFEEHEGNTIMKFWRCSDIELKNGNWFKSSSRNNQSGIITAVNTTRIFGEKINIVCKFDRTDTKLNNKADCHLFNNSDVKKLADMFLKTIGNHIECIQFGAYNTLVFSNPNEAPVVLKFNRCGFYTSVRNVFGKYS